MRKGERREGESWDVGGERVGDKDDLEIRVSCWISIERDSGPNKIGSDDLWVDSDVQL